ncbi:MAG: D-aminoacylase [Nitrospirae bacterium]|nr:D-aminoacylase [Nitrospirota bacterium]
MNRIAIKNALVYNGSGGEPFVADVMIRDGKIAAMGENIASGGATVIDASGLCLAPGFIDTHAHSEFTLLADPRAAGKIAQGVTTEINGNCGLSGGPLAGAYAERREADLKEYGIRERWRGMGEFLTLLASRNPAVNFATLVGHGNVRGAVVGYAARAATEPEMNGMKALVDEAMRAGAIGLSTGLIYPPGVYSDTAELAALASVAGRYGGIYATHMRSETDRVVESVNETIAIGKSGGLPVHISHMKTAGRRNWQKLDAIFEAIDRASESGLRVTCDRYPYTASSTDLDSVLPSWAFEGGTDAELARLNDKETLARIRRDMNSEADDESFWETVFVSSVAHEKNRWMEGMNIAAIAARLGKKPFDAMIGTIIADRLRTGAIFFGMSEDNLRRILAQEYAMVGSDASARSFDGITATGKPHPRGFGSFPRFLAKYCRDEGVLPLVEGIQRVTSLAADTFGLAGRGRIQPGAWADIVVFDIDALMDGATYENPFAPPQGIRHVFVSGVHAVRDGEITGARGGRILNTIKGLQDGQDKKWT